MKLLLLPMVLLSTVVLAQQPAHKADSFRYAPRQAVDHSLDSLPAWSDYRPRYYNVNHCYCPMTEQPVGDPRNGLSPYQYLKMDKDRQTDSTWRKAEQEFIQDFQRAVQGVDSLRRIQKPIPLQ